MERGGRGDDLSPPIDTKDTKITKIRLRQARKTRFFVYFVSFVLPGCGPHPSEPKPIVAVTRTVGSWEGRGTTTVGDVPTETGRIRIHWETANETIPGGGTFKLTLRSAISGRTIGIVADHRGVGAGTADFDEGPRTYDFLVESANIDWRFRVEETSGEVKK